MRNTIYTAAEILKRHQPFDTHISRESMLAAMKEFAEQEVKSALKRGGETPVGDSYPSVNTSTSENVKALGIKHSDEFNRIIASYQQPQTPIPEKGEARRIAIDAIIKYTNIDFGNLINAVIDVCEMCIVRSQPLPPKETPTENWKQYTGKNGWEFRDWSNGVVIESPVLEPTKDNPTGEYLQISRSGNGVKTCGVGWWILRDEINIFYPTKEGPKKETPIQENEGWNEYNKMRDLFIALQKRYDALNIKLKSKDEEIQRLKEELGMEKQERHFLKEKLKSHPSTSTGDELYEAAAKKFIETTKQNTK